MPAKDEIKILLYKRGTTITKLAEQLTACTGRKYTRSGLSSKMSRGFVRYDEMEIIAKILGYNIVFEDVK